MSLCSIWFCVCAHLSLVSLWHVSVDQGTVTAMIQCLVRVKPAVSRPPHFGGLQLQQLQRILSPPPRP